MFGSMVLAVGLSFAGGQDVRAFASGLHVLVFNDDRYPVVHASLVLGAGFVDAPASRPDLPHLVEHLAFRGRVGELTVAERMQSLGCDWNGHTGHETTSYEMSCPSRAQEAQVDTLLGLLDHGLDGLEARDVVAESRIVALEYSYRESTLLPLLHEAMAAVYGAGHPYGRDVLGADAAVSVADVVAFARERYQPDRAALVLVGDVDRAAVARALAAHPSLLDSRLTLGKIAKFSGDEVRFLGLPEGGDWYEDPDEPGKPLGFVSSREPEPLGTKQGKTPPPPAPVTRRVEVGAPLLDPITAVAWSLPGVDYSTWFQLDALAKTAEIEQAIQLPGRFEPRCYAQPGKLASTLLCWVQHSDPEDAEMLQESMAAAFARPFTWKRALKVFDEARWDDDAQWWERDTGGVATAIAAGKHLILTDLPLYYAEKYGSNGVFQQSWYTNLRATLTRARAAVVLVRPQGATVEAQQDSLMAQGVRQARTLPRDDDDTALSPILAGRTDKTYDNGLRTSVLPQPTPRGLVEILFPHPAVYPRELAYLVDRELPLPRTYRGRKLAVRYLPIRTSPWYTTAARGVRSDFGDWGEEVLLALRATFESPQLKKIPLQRVATLLRRTVRGWRAPSYWLRQREAELMLGKEVYHGPSPQRLAELALLPSEDIQEYLGAKFRPANALVVVSGQYADDLDAIGKELRKRFASWPSDEPRRKPAFWDTVPTGTPGTVVVPPLIAGSSVEVNLTCALDLTWMDAGERLAHELMIGHVLDGLSQATIRDEGGAAYVVNGDVYDDIDLELPVVKLRSFVATGDVAAVHAAMRAVVAAAPSVDDTTLRAARQRILDYYRVRADSPWSTLELVEAFEARAGGLADADRFAELLGAVTAEHLAKALAPCVGHEVVGIIGDPETVGAALKAAGIGFEVYDWEQRRAARLNELPPKLAQQEREWWEAHQR